MKKLYFRVIVMALLCQWMIACGIVPPSNTLPPKLGLSDLGIKEISFNEVKFTALVTADNPNAFTMPLANTRLELWLVGQSIATGNTQSTKIELAASKTTPVPMEFTVSTAKVVGVLRQVGKGQWTQLSYQLKGDTQWGVLGLPLSFERQGNFDALKKLGELIR